MQQISERLKQLREERGLKQEILASELGCTRFNISYYENGREPPIDLLIEYAKYFDVSIEFLIGLTIERQPKSSALEPMFKTLESQCGEHATTASDVSKLLDAMIKYYRSGAKAGHTPADALSDVLDSMTDLFLFAAGDDVAALLSAVNAVTRHTLNITGVLNAYLSNSRPDTNT